MNTKTYIDSKIVYFRNYHTSNQFKVQNKDDDSKQLIDNAEDNKNGNRYDSRCALCYLNIPHSINLHNANIEKSHRKEYNVYDFIDGDNILVGYIDINNHVWSEYECSVYNGLTAKIQYYINNDRKPPETLLNERHRYFCVVSGLTTKKGKL